MTDLPNRFHVYHDAISKKTTFGKNCRIRAGLASFILKGGKHCPWPRNIVLQGEKLSTHHECSKPWLLMHWSRLSSTKSTDTKLKICATKYFENKFALKWYIFLMNYIYMRNLCNSLIWRHPLISHFENSEIGMHSCHWCSEFVLCQYYMF